MSGIRPVIRPAFFDAIDSAFSTRWGSGVVVETFRIVDESGNTITDESGNRITWS